MKKLSLLLLLALTAGCSAYKPDLTSDMITKKAIDGQDKTICEGLSDIKAREHCVATVNDINILNTASLGGDVKLCDEVKDVDYKKSCVLAATSKQRKIESDKVEVDALNKAQNGNSIEACNKLANDVEQNQCRTNIILRQSHDQKNPKLCDAIQDSTIKNLCVKSAK